MAIIPQYGNTQQLTITLNGLPNNTMRASASVNNEVDNFVEVFIGGNIYVSSGNANTLGMCDIYTYGTVDGTNFTDGAYGIDITHTNNNNLRLLESVAVLASGNWYFGPVSISQAFGGIIPPKWGVVVHNRWGSALNGSDGGKIYYQALNYVAE